VLDWIGEENSRRRRNGEKPFRILSGSDLAFEQLQTPIGVWTVEVARAARSSLVDSLSRLVPGYPSSAVSRR
jgi:hypothetical protein